MPTLADKIDASKTWQAELRSAARIAQDMQDVIRTTTKCQAVRSLMAHNALSAEQAAALVTTSEEEAQTLLAVLNGEGAV